MKKPNYILTENQAAEKTMQRTNPGGYFAECSFREVDLRNSPSVEGVFPPRDRILSATASMSSLIAEYCSSNSLWYWTKSSPVTFQ